MNHMIEGNNYCPDNPVDRPGEFLCTYCGEEFDSPGLSINDTLCCPYCSWTHFVANEREDEYSKEFDD